MNQYEGRNAIIIKGFNACCNPLRYSTCTQSQINADRGRNPNFFLWNFKKKKN